MEELMARTRLDDLIKKNKPKKKKKRKNKKKIKKKTLKRKKKFKKIVKKKKFKGKSKEPTEKIYKTKSEWIKNALVNKSMYEKKYKEE